MITKEEISTTFQQTNIKLTEPILEKCYELCKTYNISEAEDFVDQWFAFTISNLNGAPPSLEGLEKLERKELNKLPKISKQTTESLSNQTIVDEIQEKQSTQETTGNNSVIIEDCNEDSSSVPLYSASQRFNERTDQLKVLLSYGKKIDEKTKNEPLQTVKLYKNRIGNEGGDEMETESEELKSNSKYMYEKLGTRATALNTMIHWIGDEISKKHSLELTQDFNIKTYTGEALLYGRLISSTNKFSRDSIFLETTIEKNRGTAVKLQLEKLQKIPGLFPGQIVVVRGLSNARTNNFFVNEIYTESNLIPSVIPKVASSDFLKIVIAAGPYTLPDNLNYEPLIELIQYVIETKPNVLILIGPFIDRDHKLLATLNETFQHFFQNLLNNLLEAVQQEIGSGIQVILIPSYKDVNNQPIFPTPPFDTNQFRNHQKNLFSAPNPSLLDLNGLIIGATSADILFHLNKQEIYQDFSLSQTKGPVDRIGRLVKHILNQHNFYPLYPPDSDIRIDYQLFEQFAMFDCLPHLLILPSNLKYFIKSIDGCLVINPERLVKGLVAGTFLTVQLDLTDTTNFYCEILRI